MRMGKLCKKRGSVLYTAWCLTLDASKACDDAGLNICLFEMIIQRWRFVFNDSGIAGISFSNRDFSELWKFVGDIGHCGFIFC